MVSKYADVSPLDAEVVVGGVTFDRWILGEGVDSDIEYLMHLSEPRFIAKFADGVPAPDASDLVVDVDDITFFDILWIDQAPTAEADLLALFRQAAAAIVRDSYKPDAELDDDDN